MVDKLPSGLIVYNERFKQTRLKYFDGILLGYYKNNTFYIFNHLQFHILLNQIGKDRYNVAGFNILPMSIEHKGSKSICANRRNLLLDNFNKPKSAFKDRKNIIYIQDGIIIKYQNHRFIGPELLFLKYYLVFIHF